MWDMWKKNFYQWESSTAKYLEQVLSNPLVLAPSGKMMSEAMKAKAKTDGALASMWGTLGLPTKADQERALHTINQLQSRLIDLEEKLDSLDDRV